MINKIISPRSSSSSNNINNHDDKQSPLSRWDSDDDVEEGMGASPSSVIILGGNTNDNENQHKDTDMVQQQLSPYYPSSTPTSGVPNKSASNHKKDTRRSSEPNDKHNGVTKNSSEEVSSTESTSTTASSNKRRTKRNQSFSPRSNLWSNLFFVLGSVLYLIVAVDDLQWAKEARSIPTAVLQADDDVTWVDFRLSQQEEEEEKAASNANGNANDRRLRVLQGVSEFDDYDWDEMDLDVQAAAEALGWTQDLWDNGGSVYTEDLTWSELTPDQQEAALVMGYTPEGWDGTAEGEQGEDSTTTTISNAPTASPVVPSPQGEQEETPSTLSNLLPEPTLEWESYQWDALPSVVQYAAQVLGYNEDLWNYQLAPQLVTERDPTWEELTDAEQRAAVVLGYNAETWWYLRARNTNDNDNAIAVTEEDDDYYMDMTADPTGMPSRTIEWELYDWDELPPDVQSAYSELGYNQELWESGEAADTDELFWEQLTQAQRDAATFLGYSQEMWDGNDGGTDDDSVTIQTTNSTTDMPVIPWEDYDWEELPTEIQKAYQRLGYTAEIWASGETAPTDELSWDQLSLMQKVAAMNIGYTQEMWDYDGAETVAEQGDVGGDGDSVFVEPTSTTSVTTTTDLPEEIAQWNDYYWSELPSGIQASYQALGWDENTWNTGGSARTDDLSWSELTSEEQQAAIVLGYTQAVWDNEAAADSSTSSNNSVSADDDYVFLVEASNTWVSRYMILYFAAALSFVIVGIIDFCSGHSGRQWFHANMILAGLFGLVSAMMTEKHRLASTILSLISVHFFLLEGLAIVRFRFYHQRQKKSQGSNRDNDVNIGPDVSLTSGLWWIPTVLVIADGCFVIGAVMDVVLSYFYFDRSSDYDLTLARVFGFSTLLWLLSSLLYLYVSLVSDYCSCCLEKSRQQRQEQSGNGLRMQKELQGMTLVSPLPNI